MKKKPLGHPNAIYIGTAPGGTEWWSYTGSPAEVAHLKRELRHLKQKAKKK